MALEFTEEQLRFLMNDYYGGYKQRRVQRTQQTIGGRTVGAEGYTTGNNTGYYKNNPLWRSIGDELGININSTNDLSQLYQYFNENYINTNGKGKAEAEVVENSQGSPATQDTPALKPGEDGYAYEPTNNYANNANLNTDGTTKPPGNYDYSSYDEGKVLSEAKKGITTKFYNQAYGQTVDQGESMFGLADLAGNLQAGQSATDLLNYFDNTQSQTLAAEQRKGQGGIYDEVAALAEAETPVNLSKLGGTGGPTAKMNIPPAMVGKAGNAAGVRPKRSQASKYGRNSMGTSQFNRNSFDRRSALRIKGLNI